MDVTTEIGMGVGDPLKTKGGLEQDNGYFEVADVPAKTVI